MKADAKTSILVLGLAVMGLLAWPYVSGHVDYDEARAAQRYTDACEVATGLASRYQNIGLTKQAASWRSTAEADCSISRLQALN